MGISPDGSTTARAAHEPAASIHSAPPSSNGDLVPPRTQQQQNCRTTASRIPSSDLHAAHASLGPLSRLVGVGQGGEHSTAHARTPLPALLQLPARRYWIGLHTVPPGPRSSSSSSTALALALLAAPPAARRRRHGGAAGDTIAILRRLHEDPWASGSRCSSRPATTRARPSSVLRRVWQRLHATGPSAGQSHPTRPLLNSIVPSLVQDSLETLVATSVRRRSPLATARTATIHLSTAAPSPQR